MTVREELREAATELLAGKNVQTRPENVALINNSQRGIELVARTLIDPGDTVLVESPTHSGAIVCYKNLGANIIEVVSDKKGIDIDELESLLEQLEGNQYRAKLLYTMPNFQNPTGYQMSRERRQKLAELAERFDLFIFENDMFGDMSYRDKGEEPFPLLASLVPDRVVYLSTYAGLFMPGLRTSYLAGPAELIRKVEYLGESADLFSGSIEHRIILEMLREGEMEKGLEQAITIYKGQRLAMMKALDEFMPEEVNWSKPQGGFYTWISLPDKFKTVDLLNKAVQQGVSFAPGIVFNKDEKEDNYLRLSFSAESPERIRNGVAYLANAIRFWDIKEKVPWALGDFCSRCHNINQDN